MCIYLLRTTNSVVDVIELMIWYVYKADTSMYSITQLKVRSAVLFPAVRSHVDLMSLAELGVKEAILISWAGIQSFFSVDL